MIRKDQSPLEFCVNFLKTEGKERFCRVWFGYNKGSIAFQSRNKFCYTGHELSKNVLDWIAQRKCGSENFDVPHLVLWTILRKFRAYFKQGKKFEQICGVPGLKIGCWRRVFRQFWNVSAESRGIQGKSTKNFDAVQTGTLNWGKKKIAPQLFLFGLQRKKTDDANNQWYKDGQCQGEYNERGRCTAVVQRTILQQWKVTDISANYTGDCLCQFEYSSPDLNSVSKSKRNGKCRQIKNFRVICGEQETGKNCISFDGLWPTKERTSIGYWFLDGAVN